METLGVNGRGIADYAPEPGHRAGQLPRLTVAMVTRLQASPTRGSSAGRLVSYLVRPG